MALRFASTKPIGEIVSLLLIGTGLFVSLLVFNDWLAVVFTRIGWGSRPFLPSAAEVAWASCQESVHAWPMFLLLAGTTGIRMSWLRWGRRESVARVGGRTFFDLVLIAFLCEFLLLNGDLWPMRQPLSHALARHCEYLEPWPTPPPVPDKQDFDSP